MLRSYAQEQGWIIIGIYDDEDYSGSDWQRPNFNKMIKACEERKVDIVLVKTQARFARDIELIDKYVHNKFKEWNIRFVTYIERIDNTKYETKKTSQITAMKDEWMLEDTSINIRETFRKKRENGQFTGSFAPYGYLKDPENKNHLIIDTAVADNIVRIFEEYNRGYSPRKIAQGLSNDHILSPLEYMLLNGSNLKIPIIREYTNYQSIDKAGTFIVKISYTNQTKQILKNLNAIIILTDNILFNNKLNISLHKVKNDKIQFYYTTKSLEKINIKLENNQYIYDNNFNFQDENTWKRLSINSVLPPKITCLVSHIAELDRTHEIFYEFKVYLKENRAHRKYYCLVYPKADNQSKLSFNTTIRNKHSWSAETVSKYLQNEVYIGNLVQYKTTTVSYKNHTIIYNDSDRQIRVENTHEPIIDLKLWQAVQTKIKQKKKSCQNGQVHLLAGKVFCEVCQRPFCKCGKNDENGMAYLCCKDKATKWSNCDNQKYIKQVWLQDYILDKINSLLKRFYDEKKQYGYYNQLIEKEIFNSKINNLKKEHLKISQELKNKNGYFQDLYEDRKNGFLDDCEYMTLRNKYKEDYAKLEARLKTIDQNLQMIQIKQNKLKDEKTILSKYKRIKKLNAEIINDLIEKIIIGPYNPDTNRRHIHIIWNLVN